MINPETETRIIFTDSGRKALADAANAGFKLSIKAIYFSSYASELSAEDDTLPDTFKVLPVDSAKDSGDGMVQIGFQDTSDEAYSVKSAAMVLDDDTVFAFFQPDNLSGELLSKSYGAMLMFPFFIEVNQEGFTLPEVDIGFTAPPATTESAGVVRYATSEDISADSSKTVVTPYDLKSAFSGYGFEGGRKLTDYVESNDLNDLDRTCLAYSERLTKNLPDGVPSLGDAEILNLSFRDQFFGNKVFQFAFQRGFPEPEFRLRAFQAGYADKSSWFQVPISKTKLLHGAAGSKARAAHTFSKGLSTAFFHADQELAGYERAFFRLGREPFACKLEKSTHKSVAVVSGSSESLLIGSKKAVAESPEAVRSKGDVTLAADKDVNIRVDGGYYHFRESLVTPKGEVFAKQSPPSIDDIPGLRNYIQQKAYARTVFDYKDFYERTKLLVCGYGFEAPHIYCMSNMGCREMDFSGWSRTVYCDVELDPAARYIEVFCDIKSRYGAALCSYRAPLNIDNFGDGLIFPLFAETRDSEPVGLNFTTHGRVKVSMSGVNGILRQVDFLY